MGFVAETEHEFDEGPQGFRAETQTPDCVGGPDGESSPAAVVTLLAVAAKYPPAPAGFLVIAVLGVAK